MVWRSLSNISFSEAKKLLVGSREQLGKKDTEFDWKVSHSSKTTKWNKKKIIVILKRRKMFFLRKMTKISNLILCFSQIPKIFIFTRLRLVAFVSEDWKKLSIWTSVLFKVFALEMRKTEAYRNQTGSNVSVLIKKVSVLELDQIMQVSHIVSWILANTWPNYQHSRWNTYQYVPLFQWFN